MNEWKSIFSGLLLFVTLHGYGQSTSSRNFKAVATTEEVKVDGMFSEQVWISSTVNTGFILNFPNDTAAPANRTEVMMCYDSKNFYFAVVCHKKAGERITARTLQRDFDPDQNDAFTIAIDPQLDNTNGFLFTVGARGVQSEALIHAGSRTSRIWDNKWEVATQIHPEKWQAEIRIPFRTLRFNNELNQWGINFIRIDLANAEKSVWNPVPREFTAHSLNYTGRVEWDTPLEQPRKSISLIPYGTAGYQRTTGQAPTELLNVGGDAKIALTSALNLDLTINPDFSQAEADAQQINLDRFSLYFPERRNFFIENDDLFSNFGFTKIRPFFSRRIGLSEDGDLIPIYFGARLSGKLTDDLRVGLLNVQTGTDEQNNLSNNYTVACFQKQISGSNLGGIFVNREGFDGNGPDYNRVVGVDYNILSKDNRLMGKLFYHQSFTDDTSSWQRAHASWISYRSRTMRYVWNHEYVSKDYTAEVGFVPREGRGYWRLEPWIEKSFYPRSKWLNSHGPQVYYDLYTNEALEPTDQRMRLSYFMVFNNLSGLRVNAVNTYIKLLKPFNPNPSDTLLFPTGDYSWNSVSFAFNPSGRKKLNFALSGEYGTFFLGTKLSYGGSINYRFEPYVNFSFRTEFNQLDMPGNYQDNNLILLSPRVDISFTRKLFFTSFVQLNQQASNLAINTRLQYRFKPMSDFFIVYNESFDTSNEVSLRRAIILKLNYWLNL